MLGDFQNIPKYVQAMANDKNVIAVHTHVLFNFGKKISEPDVHRKCAMNGSILRASEISRSVLKEFFFIVWFKKSKFKSNADGNFASDMKFRFFFFIESVEKYHLEIETMSLVLKAISL